MGLCHSTGYSLKSGVTGDFHRPYENSEIVSFSHSSDDTPSVSHSLDSSLSEGAGVGLVPFNRVLAKIRGFGRFSSPLRNSEDVSFYHSSKYTPSEREPGMGGCHSLGGYGMILLRFKYRSSSEKMQPQYF